VIVLTTEGPWKDLTIGQNDQLMKDQYRIIGCLLLWMLPALLLSQNQAKNLDSLSKAFDPFGMPQYQEKVFVHTDKPYYLTGETIWFNAYCTNLKEGHLTELSRVLYVELSNSDNQPVMQLKTSLKSGVGHGQMLLSTKLATGSYVLRAYTAWMRNSHQKYFYQQRIMVINPLTALPENSPSGEKSTAILNLSTGTGTVNEEPNLENRVKVTTNKEIYANREAVMLELMTSHSEEYQDLTLSISVYPYHRQLENNDNNNLLPRENPEEHQVSAEQATAGPLYFPETIGPIIYGKSEKSGYSDTQSSLFVSIAGKSSRIYEVVGTDSNNFAVELPPAIDFQHLYFWSKGYRETNITLQDPFDKRPPQLSAPAWQFDSSTIEFIEGQSVNMQVSNLYQEYTKIHGYQQLERNWGRPFYGHPEFQYYLDDYTRFLSLDEVIREYIKYVSPRKRGGSLNLYVWDEYTNSHSLANNVFFDNPALVMLDGVPVNDLGWVMDIDPLLIETIDVVTKKYFIGDEVFSGMINLKTYHHHFAGLELPLIIDRKSYQSIQNPKEFYHPDHGESASANKRIPDRRNTLYWNPHIAITSEKSEQLQFYTGDTTGEYLIEIYGITSQGNPIYQTKKIRVIKSNTP